MIEIIKQTRVMETVTISKKGQTLQSRKSRKQINQISA